MKKYSDLQNYINGNPDPDDRPLPEIVMADIGAPFTWIDNDEGERLFRVSDWVYGVSGSSAKNRRNPWIKLKKRLSEDPNLRGVLFCHPLALETAGGKQFVDFATAEQLYAITQRMSDRSPVTQEIKAYLAKAGVIVDEQRIAEQQKSDKRIDKYRDMGKSESWIDARIGGIYTRDQFTSTLRRTVLRFKNQYYGIATNDIYQGLWGKVAAELREDFGYEPTDRIEVRDHLTELALDYVRIAERICTRKLGDERMVNWDKAREIVKLVAHAIGKQVQATSELLGMDIPTGKPLLDDGADDSPVAGHVPF